MKTIVSSHPFNPGSSANPFKPAAVPVFCALAFLPAILNLMSAGVTVVNLPAALGPGVAGFWIAAAVPQIRVSMILLGPALGALLWAANWFIMAGKCCSSMY